MKRPVRRNDTSTSDNATVKDDQALVPPRASHQDARGLSFSASIGGISAGRTAGVPSQPVSPPPTQEPP